jgi:thiamine pyrophosphokinase
VIRVTGSWSHALIVGDGEVEPAELARLVSAAGDTPRPVVLAADGGANRCLAAGCQPDVVIGDLDSLDDEARRRLEGLGVGFVVADPAKDESDMELCVTAALEAGATRITILGALGPERPEHGIANILLLADPRFDGLAISILGRASRITRIGSAGGPGEASLAGQRGDWVSLFPLAGPVSGVTTSGLRFPLRGETLELGRSRGLSNELLDSVAVVSTERGRLLLVHTSGPLPQRPEASHPPDRRVA